MARQERESAASGRTASKKDCAERNSRGDKGNGPTERAALRRRWLAAAATVALFAVGLSTAGSAAASTPTNPNDKPTKLIPCPDDNVLLSDIMIVWRESPTVPFTNIAVKPTPSARAQVIGSGRLLVDEFFACMSEISDTGATIHAKRNVWMPAGPTWGCWQCDLWIELVGTKIFSPDSQDAANWQTFIDQLQCHDGAPRFWEAVTKDRFGEYNLGGDMWDLEGSRAPTRNRFTWFLSACNWD